MHSISLKYCSSDLVEKLSEAQQWRRVLKLFVFVVIVLGGNVYSPEDSTRWDWFVVHLPDIWTLFTRCYDFSK